jgi:hypothetical protein
VINDEEIDDLLSKSNQLSSESGTESTQLEHIKEKSIDLAKTIVARKLLSTRQGIELRLDKLKELYNLSNFDLDVFLICLAPELNLAYEKIYAYLQDDVTRKRPGVDLVLRILCHSLAEQVAAHRRFVSSAPLFQNDLLQLFDEPHQQRTPLLGKYLKIDERVVNYLLSCDAIADRLSPYMHMHRISAAADFRDLLLPDDVKTRLGNITEKLDLKLARKVAPQNAQLTVVGLDAAGLKSGDILWANESHKFECFYPFLSRVEHPVSSIAFQ